MHPAREPLPTLDHIRRTIGEYNFAGQHQQSPALLGGGLVKADWFKRYGAKDRPERFERIVQSWDTANKATELSDYSVCTTWAPGIEGPCLEQPRLRMNAAMHRYGDYCMCRGHLIAVTIEKMLPATKGSSL
ncbi:MAG TPA: hypothetical protein VGI28_12400 [Stellaceae bacterium]